MLLRHLLVYYYYAGTQIVNKFSIFNHFVNVLTCSCNLPVLFTHYIDISR